MKADVSSNRRGFSLLELIISMVMALVIMGSVVQVMIVQGRGYRKQREMVDTRDTSRQAAALLAWDLRQSVIGEAPFASLGANAVAIRSPRAVGTICAKHATLARYGVWKSAGTFLATDSDTAVVYAIGRDKWRKLKITAVGTPTAMEVPACAWPGARPPDIVVEFAVRFKTDTSWIRIGAPLRTFRRVEYGEYEANGRWWLGRRVGAAASYEQLTGPLLAPASNGLKFTYYDTLGFETVDPGAIGSVEFTLRTESYKKTNVGTNWTYQRDSLTTRVAVRR
ncbi:MAG TPA: prepilin-type N-terminal cleavage/methylation domain-containing protein [Gemmatimonadaceae bacterium]|nr:prepilin-type N-terminal cleavage/methylation domain-containing protein [Gemmatimonadaceae bacterium]